MHNVTVRHAKGVVMSMHFTWRPAVNSMCVSRENQQGSVIGRLPILEVFDGYVSLNGTLGIPNL